jgi:hypothetical protein
LAAFTEPLTAQTRGLAAELRKAEEHCRADRLPQAEALYQQALTVAVGADRRLCFDRLLLVSQGVFCPAWVSGRNNRQPAKQRRC